MLAPDRSRSAAVLWGYAGPVLRLQGSLGRGSAFARCAMEGLIASNARSGAVPLPLSSARAMGDLGPPVDMKRSCRDN